MRGAAGGILGGGAGGLALGIRPGGRTFVEKEEGVDREVNTSGPASVMFVGCRNSTYRLKGACAKVTIEACEGCRFEVDGIVRAQSIELIRVKKSHVEIRTMLPTFALDMCEEVHLHFFEPRFMDWLYLNRCRDIHVQTDDYPPRDRAYRIPVDPEDLGSSEPWRWEKMQYRCRFSEASTPASQPLYMTEPVVRNASGYVLNASDGLTDVIDAALKANEEKQKQLE